MLVDFDHTMVEFVDHIVDHFEHMH
jgi:hypothetical protein